MKRISKLFGSLGGIALGVLLAKPLAQAVTLIPGVPDAVAAPIEEALIILFTGGLGTYIAPPNTP